MALDVYLNFNGNCRQAVEFYAEVFEAEKLHIMTFGEAPPNPEFNLPEEAKDLVMHTHLNIMGSTVMFSDVFPGMPFTAGNNISLTIVSKNTDEIKSLYGKLKEAGTVSMELQETFWSKCYGMVTDKFGIHWQLSHDDGQTAM
ncbi:VOC family protein [Paenibacillus wynnii]|uniref:VOC family protein n=1 Tax=Paenibacillus wynnii TaxID=268407 RepID=UPI002790A3EA|nr:VOC family protein [Paenibacillus wynnii]MDQ0196616.1 PhnB protein [Paenibacillus wynnii]